MPLSSRARTIGPWTIERELGRGAMAVVFLARHGRTGQRAAVKVLQGTGPLAEEELQRFRREGKVLARLSHPAILSVFDAGEEGERPYLAMAYVSGGDLERVLRRKTKLPIDACLDLLRPLADGLALAHDQGIVHRDLKPANVLLDPEGRPLLSDFGLARLTAGNPTLKTRTGQLLGTPAYMAPEQVRGEKAGPEADVYALGALAYRCVTGRLPIEGEDLGDLLRRKMNERPPPARGLRPDCPPGLSEVIQAALSPVPTDRPTARAFRRRLEGSLEAPRSSGAHRTQQGRRAIFAPSPSPAERTMTLPGAAPSASSPPGKERRWLGGAVALSLLLLGGGLLLSRRAAPFDPGQVAPARFEWDLREERLTARWETRRPARARFSMSLPGESKPRGSEEGECRSRHELSISVKELHELGTIVLEEGPAQGPFQAVRAEAPSPPIPAEELVQALTSEALFGPPADELIRTLGLSGDPKSAFPGPGAALAPAPTLRQKKALRWLPLSLASRSCTGTERLAVLRACQPFLWWEAVYESLGLDVPETFRMKERLRRSFPQELVTTETATPKGRVWPIPFRDGERRILAMRCPPAKSARDKPGRREGSSPEAILDEVGFGLKRETERTLDGEGTGLGLRYLALDSSIWGDLDLSSAEAPDGRTATLDLSVRRRPQDAVAGWALWIAWHDGRTAPRLEQLDQPNTGLVRRRWKARSPRLFSLLLPLPAGREELRHRFGLPRGSLAAQPYGLQIWITRLSDARTEYRPVVEVAEAKLVLHEN